MPNIRSPLPQSYNSFKSLVLIATDFYIKREKIILQNQRKQKSKNQNLTSVQCLGQCTLGYVNSWQRSRTPHARQSEKT